MGNTPPIMLCTSPNDISNECTYINFLQEKLLCLNQNCSEIKLNKHKAFKKLKFSYPTSCD